MKTDKGKVKAPEKKSGGREGGILTKLAGVAKSAANAPARAAKGAAMSVAGTPSPKNKTKASAKAAPNKTTQGAKKDGYSFDKYVVRRAYSNEAYKTTKNAKGK